MSSILDLTARQTAQVIARGEVTAGDAVEARIARIEAINPKLNAVVWKRFDAARAEAKAVDAKRKSGEALGLLAGVAVTLKDSLDLKGAPSTFGLPSRAQTLASADEVHVDRLRRSGAIVLGKTNVAQMLLFLESDNPLYGRTNNPWNLARSPGGSSGGEAAAIAAQMSALGLGTDVGGSARNPAAVCGIAGIKPTMGRCPDVGAFSYPLGQNVIESQVGVLARTVEDVALGLEIINGGANPPSDPPRPLGDYTKVDLSKLKIGYAETDGMFAACPASRRAVREAAAALGAAGATVFAWAPPRVNEAVALFYGIMTAGGRGYARILGPNKADPRVAQLIRFGNMSHSSCRRLALLLKALGQASLATAVATFGRRSTEEYWDLVEELTAYRASFAAAMRNANNLDLILWPASPLPALTHGASLDLGTMGGYTNLYNALGLPAGIVPVTRVQASEESDRPRSRDRIDIAARKVEQGSAGCPIGVQIAGRPWREHEVLAAMAAIEVIARKSPDYPLAPEV
jgi:fatty acid amide hydrolase